MKSYLKSNRNYTAKNTLIKLEYGNSLDLFIFELNIDQSFDYGGLRFVSFIKFGVG
jgi:hypothetical protein